MICGIAMVFQSYALYPHMTAFENMAFALGLRHMPNTIISEKVRHAADTLGITQLLDKRPRQLSGGQRQRRGGCAIVRIPAVLFLRRAVESGCEAAGRDAGPGCRPAPGAAQHHGVRHPRPGRGDHSRRSRGGHEGRRGSTSAPGRWNLSSPGQSLRGRIPRTPPMKNPPHRPPDRRGGATVLRRGYRRAAGAGLGRACPARARDGKSRTGHGRAAGGRSFFPGRASRLLRPR